MNIPFFNKKVEQEPIEENPICEKRYEVDKYCDKVLLEIIDNLIKKAKVQDDNRAIAHYVCSWTFCGSKTLRDIYIYLFMEILNRLDRIEKLIKSNNKSHKCNQKSKDWDNLVKKK